MGIVIGSCSHILDWDWAQSKDSTYAIKGYNRECQRAAAYITTCATCKQDYLRSKMILTSKEQVSAWIHRGNTALNQSEHKHKRNRHNKAK